MRLKVIFCKIGIKRFLTCVLGHVPLVNFVLCTKLSSLLALSKLTSNLRVVAVAVSSSLVQKLLLLVQVFEFLIDLIDSESLLLKCKHLRVFSLLFT